MHITCPNVSFTSSLSFLHVRKNGEWWEYYFSFLFTVNCVWSLLDLRADYILPKSVSVKSKWLKPWNAAASHRSLVSLATVLVSSRNVPPQKLTEKSVVWQSKDGCAEDKSLPAAVAFRERDACVLAKKQLLTNDRQKTTGRKYQYKVLNLPRNIHFLGI